MKQIILLTICIGIGFLGFSNNQNLNELNNSLLHISSVSEVLNQTPKISVYPNPTTSKITVSSATVSLKTVSLFDVLGKKVTTVFANNGKAVELNMEDFSSGVYIMQITDANNTIHTKKVVKR
ncbi:T9SS type A sorting domain-containing protein [Patiriisocius hiemis]|uniref:T9SS type A sorting domain-containing protein n=1 Tax=Patiriisocius hiemis TaxID=3075604 RepID=A0ABU2Y940_9FLAO|nr:T9SS type A sorting domain-containing protein [Constantimarinum sp. W242]MDT0554690.1 T9SS type A sorting domain-containing protein [Constantimarinum sp. W242]